MVSSDARAIASPSDTDAAQTSALRSGNPLLWTNPHRTEQALPGSNWNGIEIGPADYVAAAQRFARFRPVLQQLFPKELTTDYGTIESALIRVPTLQQSLGMSPLNGRLFVKADHSLPVAGSIKARGGVHEVLEFAEDVARKNGLLHGDDLLPLLGEKAKALFSKYQIAVGSTGNLGLSIGVIASALGFRATVHMSSDAKEWKKERLRHRGVSVVEHEGDYEAAVAAGRDAAQGDDYTHFVDDEQSRSLFFGYAAAVLHLSEQLAVLGVPVDAEHPLFVYIPCGVGGAPGGIAYGLAHVFGPHVHCFFAEPTASPCFLVAMQDEEGKHPSVYDIGLTNKTEADGLAVPRASKCAVEVMRPCLSGVFTVSDDELFPHVYRASVAEDIRVEPSATAAFDGPGWLTRSKVGAAYLAKHGLTEKLADSAHIIWTTGGLFVPEEEYRRFVQRGEQLVRAKNAY